LFTDTCECGEKFRGRRSARRFRYEVHWRQEHENELFPFAQVAVTRAEAQRIYSHVRP
jgi:hypothetical protein